MKYGAEVQDAARGDDGLNNAQDGLDRDGRNVPSDSVRNWAWTTSHSQYDWMDSHAPFACVD